MSRIVSGDGWELREGRWEDSPPEAVDHVIGDPPYDERTHENRRSGMVLPERDGRGRQPRKADASLFGSAAAVKSFDPIDPANLAPKLVAIAQRWVVLFCAAEQLGRYETAAGDQWVRAGAWFKLDPTPQFSGDRPGQGYEGVAIMHRAGRKRWNRGGHAAVWRCSSEAHFSAEDVRVHETQKPLRLMRALIEDFTDPGDLVWDPYAGSATTGVACLQLGRRFLGHEMQARYFDVACERLQAAERGQKLSEYRAGQGVLFGGHKP